MFYMTKQLAKNKLCVTVALILFSMSTSCISMPPDTRAMAQAPVVLPFLRLEQGGECYFIDDFMPTPDSLVMGKATGLSLRYYTYWNAQYKYWSEVGVMLSFYSRDNRCWSLFEEYILPEPDSDFGDNNG
jgi:hypothetical protein